MLKNFLDDTEDLFTPKKVLALSIFKVLPLVELFVAFLGEYIAKFIDPKYVLIFCASYPIMMGSIQKLMAFFNSRYDLDLDMVAELYSLFYASLPYKLVYLDIEDTLLGFIVLGIKILFKTLIYIITPCIKQRKLKKAQQAQEKPPSFKPEETYIELEKVENKSAQNKIEVNKHSLDNEYESNNENHIAGSSIEHIQNYLYSSQKEINEKVNINAELDNKIDDQNPSVEKQASIVSSEKIAKNKHGILLEKRQSSKIRAIVKTLVNFEELNDTNEFTLKFMIHTFSDTTQNFAVMVLLLSVNFIFPHIQTSQVTFENSLLVNVTIWSASELLVDMAFLFVCIPMYQKWWFKNQVGDILKLFKDWLKNAKVFLFMGVIGVTIIVFYIIFLVVLV